MKASYKQWQMKHRKQYGFTIVELLIVIVVIGILAAITVIAFNGVQERAKQAAVISDLSTSSKKIMASAAGGPPVSTVEALSSSDVKISLSPGLYNIVTYCATNNSFVLAAESKSGNKFYTKNNASAIQDNSINAHSPCASLGVQNTDGSAANKTFMGMASTSCATENTACTFSGPATIAYGSSSLGRFNALPNMTSPVQCTNAVFGDPAVGYGKACYVISY
jgi:prepilin-type N-terminal cleavage/methylation domain-containing protein